MTRSRAPLLIAATLLAHAPATSRAQSATDPAHPVSLAVMSETLGYTPNAVHPGVEVGYEVRYVREGAYEMAQAVHLGWLHHPRIMTGAYLDTSLVQRAVFSFGLYGELGLGVGAQVTGTPVTTYAANDAGDALVARADDPRAMVRLTAAAAIGFDLREAGAPGVRLFVRYAETVLAPFAPGNSLPLFVAAQVAVGLTVPMTLLADR
ncbi:MAG: hypothetical protein H6719_22960 [Sandaracinaceae bacterium]|nr:hypothetical protein [Sandaracinaceae bacterium]